MMLLLPAFRSHGRNVRFDPSDVFSFETIAIGDDVFIGPGAHFSATVSSITIGSKVLFGPGVTILGGDHNTGVRGMAIADVKEKRPSDDRPVVIEDDVWIGANVTILKGVTIGRGSVVAAGAVVRSDVPPSTVVAGVPARVVRKRFPGDELDAERSAD